MALVTATFFLCFPCINVCVLVSVCVWVWLFVSCIVFLPEYDFLARLWTAHACILYSTEEAFFMSSEQDNDDEKRRKSSLSLRSRSQLQVGKTFRAANFTRSQKTSLT